MNNFSNKYINVRCISHIDMSTIKETKHIYLNRAIEEILVYLHFYKNNIDKKLKPKIAFREIENDNSLVIQIETFSPDCTNVMDIIDISFHNSNLDEIMINYYMCKRFIKFIIDEHLDITNLSDEMKQQTICSMLTFNIESQQLFKLFQKS